MILNVIGLALIGVAALALSVSAWRAFRSRRAILRWAAMPLAVVIAVLLLLASVVGTMGAIKVYGPRGNPVQELTVEGTDDQIARGRHLVNAVCASCHGREPEFTLPLVGGADVTAEIGLPVGTIFVANLTPTGRIDEWTDGEVARAIREGVDSDGNVLPIMSIQRFYNLSADDLKSIIAYLRAEPPAGEPTPPSRLSLLGLILVGANLLPFEPAPDTDYWVDAPPKGPTIEYGEYIVGYNDCNVCHGADLTGGTNALVPRGPNLRVVKTWTVEQFIATFRTGISPTRGPLDNDEMPWEFYGRMDDEELAALYAYLTSLD